MSEPIEGSVELWDGDQSLGLSGKRWTLEAVPVVVEAVHGITDIAPVEPTEQPTGRIPDAAWTGTGALGQPVSIYLWADIPYEETAVAQAIAAAIAESEGP